MITTIFITATAVTCVLLKKFVVDKYANENNDEDDVTKPQY